MKKVVAIIALMFALSFVVFPVDAVESRLVWTFFWEGMDVKIWAPYQTYPGDMISVRVVVEAREELQNVMVQFKIHGSRSEGNQSWHDSFYALQNVDLSLGAVEDQYFDMNIPGDVDSGMVFSETSCVWSVQREMLWQEQFIEGAFRVTYLRNKPYEDLEVAYSQLLADYNELVSNYTTLQADYEILLGSYGDLLADYQELLTNHTVLQNHHNSLEANYDALNSTYRNLYLQYSSLQTSFDGLTSKYEFGGETANALDLMYVFIETTVIFTATTIYFVLRRYRLTRRKSQL